MWRLFKTPRLNMTVANIVILEEWKERGRLMDTGKSLDIPLVMD